MSTTRYNIVGPALITFIAMCGGVASAAEVADRPTAELLSGERFAASLVAIANNEIRFGPVGEEPLTVESAPLEELLSWGGLASAARRPTVILQQGSRLIAAPAWTREGSIRLAEEVFALHQTVLDDVKLPKSAVKMLLYGAARDPDLYAAAIDEAKAYSSASDRIWLTSGDALSGKLTSIASGRLSLEVDGEALEIAKDRIVVVRLADETSDAEASKNSPKIAIGLRDGGLLLAEQVELNEESELSVRLTSQLSIAGRRSNAITLLQPLGGRVQYLSDLAPLDYRHTPYFDLAWGYGRDKNLFGRQLCTSGRGWLKGLSMHSASRLVYRVEPRFNKFECDVALDDSSAGSGESHGSVVFRVLVARGGSFAPAFESGVVRTGDEPQRVAVDIAGAQAIALVVDWAETGVGDTLDHANWLGARFVE